MHKSSSIGKKDYLNKDLYRIHLQAATEWGKLWNCCICRVGVAINAFQPDCISLDVAEQEL
jgi:hypothetical protein